MTHELAGMCRTLKAAAGATLIAAASIATLALLGGGPIITALITLGVLGTVAAGVLTATLGLIVQRQRHVEQGEPDLFIRMNLPRSEEAVRAGKCATRTPTQRWIARNLFGHHLLVGDTVRIRSIDEIRRTLDTIGELDGLPFMDEMAAFCGHTARVYRVLDKIYDYGRSRRMRRLEDSVLLVGLRCDGSAHGGCEAACYMVWKRQWLGPVRASAATPILTTSSLPQFDQTSTHSTADPIQRTPLAATHGSVPHYECQYTKLTNATHPIGRFDLNRTFGALVVGNVSIAAFLVAAMTRLANALQVARGGVAYPALPRLEKNSETPVVALNAGQWVRVNTTAQIATTLDRNSKNRGLWFDADMLKHAGRTCRVLGRIERIIDIASGQMIPMRTPCIVLDGVHYSGEFQWFGEQHDYLYWREAWLKPIDPPTARTADETA